MLSTQTMICVEDTCGALVKGVDVFYDIVDTHIYIVHVHVTHYTSLCTISHSLISSIGYPKKCFICFLFPFMLNYLLARDILPSKHNHMSTIMKERETRSPQDRLNKTGRLVLVHVHVH